MPPTSPPTQVEGIVEYHNDIQTRFRSKGTEIDSLWRSFGREQRLRCFRGTVHEKDKYRLLKHDQDVTARVRTMPLCYIMPEWNLKDVVDSGPSHFLKLVEHRATTSLSEQLWKGLNGGLGDYPLIFRNTNDNGLKHPDSELFRIKNTNVSFQEGVNYGRVFERNNELLTALRPSFPQDVGDLVILRQFRLLQSIHLMVENILTEASKVDSLDRPSESQSSLAAVMPAVSPNIRPTISDLACRARDQSDWLQHRLESMGAEPDFLANAVYTWFETRPGLVADEKGHTWPLRTDKYISTTFFDVHHDAVKTSVIGAYLSRLLQLLESTNEGHRILRPILLKEVGEVCHLEFERAKLSLTRHIQRGTGTKWFKRVTGVTDLGGNAKVIMTVQPEDLTRKDPQMSYILRLCDDNIDISASVQWLENIGSLHDQHPSERERLNAAEFEALCNLAHVVSFQSDVQLLLPPRHPSATQHWRFLKTLKELDTSMASIRDELDLRDVAFPINALKNPAVAERALARMNDHVLERSGKSMDASYQSLVEDCITQLQARYEELKTANQDVPASAFQSTSEPDPKPGSLKGKQPDALSKGKEKTHAPQPQPAEPALPQAGAEPAPQPPQQAFRVRRTTAEVFSEIFDRSTVQAPVNWSDFQSAMIDLGFSAQPRYGSVFTFIPSSDLGLSKSFTIHRAHGSKMERYLLQYVARRLNRLYGWTRDTFELL